MSYQQSLLGSLQSGLQFVRQYEDEITQALALSLLPLEDLTATAEDQLQACEALGTQCTTAFQDTLAQALLDWFKASFFTWVNNAPCAACSSSSTRLHCMEGPGNDEERRGAAGRVEVYHCPACGGYTRYPRYNLASKLLETRRGRCGEWANCFLLFCRAAGLEVRHVTDSADHVWTEYWSEAGGRWIHMDPCEAAYDKPLLYEAGWGKSPTWVLASHYAGVKDVTPRYTNDLPAVHQRRPAGAAEWLEAQCTTMTKALRFVLPEDASRERRDAAENAELAARQAPSSSSSPAEALPGRQTGNAAWRAARGEGGSSKAGLVPPMGASWRRARASARRSMVKQMEPSEDAVHPVHICSITGAPQASQQPSGCLTGGYVAASGENRPSETALHAFDGNPGTKWLDFGGSNGGTTWLAYALPQAQEPAVLACYSLTSGNDAPVRDPRDWILEGRPATGTGTWQELDSQQGVNFDERGLAKQFPVSTTHAARELRLRITATRAPCNCVQLASLCLMRARPDLAKPSVRSSSPPPARSEADVATKLKMPSPLDIPVSRHHHEHTSAATASNVQPAPTAPAGPAGASSPGQGPDLEPATAELAKLDLVRSQPANLRQDEHSAAAQRLVGRKLVPGQHEADGPGKAERTADGAQSAQDVQSRPEQLAAEVRRLFTVYTGQGLAPNDAAAKALTEAQDVI